MKTTKGKIVITSLGEIYLQVDGKKVDNIVINEYKFLKPMKMMEAHDADYLMDGLASSEFRAYILMDNKIKKL